MAKEKVPANLTEKRSGSGRKVWCHTCESNRKWREVCWVGVMDNFLDRRDADSIENEISSTRLQCVSCFIQGLSKEDETHIKGKVKTFHTSHQRIEHGKARSIDLTSMELYQKVGGVMATREQSSRSSASTHASTFMETIPPDASQRKRKREHSPVAIPPVASERMRKLEHRDVLRIMFQEKRSYEKTIGYSRQTRSPGDRTFGGTWKEQSDVYGGIEILENGGDQYLGINSIRDGDTDLVFFNWATVSNTKKNVQQITVLDATTREVTTKGYALCNDTGAHNLCLLPPDVGDLAEIFGGYIAFAVGGEYRDAEDKRNKKETDSKFYKGISLYGLKRYPLKSGQSRANPPWSDYWWYNVQLLVKGDHTGQIEGREQCIRPDGVGISEFDGQTSACMLEGALYLFARSNPELKGYRSVQTVKIEFNPKRCKGQPGHMSVSRFRMCTFEGLPAGSDVYFMHVYTPLPRDNKACFIGILSLAWPPGDTRETGIYLAMSVDGVQFTHPEPLHLCNDYLRRGYEPHCFGRKF